MKTFTRLLAVIALVALPATAAAQSADAPDASVESPRAWLSARGNTPQLSIASNESGPSPWRSAALLIVLAGLGGAALFMRLKRRRSVVKREIPALAVVASTRVGPKAHAVVARVGNRTLLLGVTDHSVQRIAWLEGSDATENATEPDVEEPSDLWDGPLPGDRPREPARSQPARAAAASYAAVPAARSAPAMTNTSQSGQSAGFRDVLMTALGRPSKSAPAETTAALAIAEETEDRYVPSQKRAEMLQVESQAAGLIARLDGMS